MLMQKRAVILLILSLIVCAVTVGATATGASAQDNTRVWGTVRSEGGYYEFMEVQPLGPESDEFFTYWVGLAGERGVLQDPYSQIWYPGPVEYLRTTIWFRGEPLEGFVRVWGKVIPYIDGDWFFGVDGMVYRLIKKYKRIGPTGKRHKRLKYSYYMNLTTGERSDMAPRTEEELAALRQYLTTEGGNAFPRWYVAPEMAEQAAAEDESPTGALTAEGEAGGEGEEAEGEGETETPPAEAPAGTGESSGE
jgi:hypothetical protein